MMKQIDLNKTVAQLVEEYPELKELLADLGFREILRPMTLQMMGSILTIPRGAKVKGISLQSVIAKLKAAGFAVQADEKQCRQEELRSMVARLSAGESLETVRAAFVERFSQVSVEEIADAEQHLIKSGMPVREVQKLCDVHSALFHGRTENEVLADEIHRQAAKVEEGAVADLPEEHPLRVLEQENAGLAVLLDAMEKEMAGAGEGAKLLAGLGQLNGLYAHYGKKEELLMPFLYDYGVTGPSQVMWGVDDEIKKEMGTIRKALAEDPDSYLIYRGRLQNLLTRIREMIYKEEKILFPLALRYFTEEQWYQVYRDASEMGYAFLAGNPPVWEAGEVWISAEQAQKQQADMLAGKVQMPTGELCVKELQHIFSLLPLDITFIDAKDVLRFFVNEGRIFARPMSALGREVFRCHPPQIVPVVRQMLADFKAKKKARMEIWSYIKGKPVGVQYLAVYDDAGNYIGTVELVQDFTKALEKFAGK